MGPQAEKQNVKGKHIVIKTIDGVVARILIEDYDDSGEMIIPYWANYWCKRLDSRSRLDDTDRLAMRVDAEEALAEFGVELEAIRAMAITGVVEVTIPFDADDLDPARKEPSSIEYALMMPWEYLLSSATKPYRNNYSLCVVRHIDGNNKATERFRESKKRGAKKTTDRKDHGGFCFIETAPAEFSDIFDFSIERELVEGAFGEVKPVHLSTSPSIEELTTVIESACPDIVHVSGIDSRSGAKLKRKINARKEVEAEPANQPEVNAETKNEIVDGLYFANENRLAADTDFRTIAHAVSSGKRKPQLVGFNCQYSGSRIAPFCVAQGAREAIGIQNTLDDDLAERFFIRFYQYWNTKHTNSKGESSNQDSLAAFIAAWDFIKPMGKSAKGTGIILWFNTSVFGKRTQGMIEPSLRGIETVKAQLKSDKIEHSNEKVVANKHQHKIQDLVSVSVETLDVITPCMLHYGESVLKKLYFLFKNLTPSDENPVECIKGINVEVTLTVGQESYRYQTQVSLGLDHPNLELTNRNLVATDENPPGGIQVPLTSGLIKMAEDNIRGSLYVHIEWEGQVLQHRTYSVNIAPVNEWRLNEKDSLLQPMFVQPRDNAVKDIIKKAQNYLQCIEGSTDASFCGYQADDIEPQINAIWTALILDYQLGYVSPPPSFNAETQRLRTPSQVLSEGRGTCVDLALLVAACLEWIELFPVVINTAKHTFVGCWRYDAEDAYDGLNEWNVQCYREFLKQHKRGEYGSATTVVEYPWVFHSDNYAVFNELIYYGSVIPMEAVCITERKMYGQAKDYAIQYFGEEGIQSVGGEGGTEFDPGEFESVTDVKHSRQFLQPLPLMKNERTNG